MKAKQRRQQLLELLENERTTISATRLASILGVSRQVIVGDIALLRAFQHDIISTPKGYVMSSSMPCGAYNARIVCQHSFEETQNELEIIVKNGGLVSTVEIEHPIYGMLTAPLNIKTQEDIDDFMKKIKLSQAELLSSLTDGIHSHLVSCPTLEDFQKIKRALKKAGLLYQD